jgi:hypothetical protein
MVNWRLVFRHILPALYVPLGTLLGFGILLAVTGAARYPYVGLVGFVAVSVSFVLVFAHLATRDTSAARVNVTALATAILIVIAVGVGLRGAWHVVWFWAGVALLAVPIALAAFLGVGSARLWAAWQSGRRVSRDPTPAVVPAEVDPSDR